MQPQLAFFFKATLLIHTEPLGIRIYQILFLKATIKPSSLYPINILNLMQDINPDDFNPAQFFKMFLNLGSPAL